MSHVLLFLCAFIMGILCLAGIYAVVKDITIRKEQGQKLIGTKISSKEINTGKGSYYHMEVAYRINGAECRQRLVSTSKKFRVYQVNEPIPLIYVSKNDKVYWAEDNHIESIFRIVFLALSALFWFAFAFFFMMMSLSVFFS